MTTGEMRPGRWPKGSKTNKLETWEVPLVKAMIAKGTIPQEIQAYFSRPGRTVNHARILEIRDGFRHASITAASPAQLDSFLRTWPHVDPATGLHLVDDELLVKAREAMLHAVQGYNNPRSFFKAEMFIVGAVIGWTYLLHWLYRRDGVDYRHHTGAGTARAVARTKHGAEKLWELSQCMSALACPLDDPTKANLEFLIELRHEIEHQMTRRIDDAIGAKLQACCLNFNSAIKTIAGDRYGLEAELSFALQFSGIERDQRNLLLKEMDLPKHLVAMQLDYESRLTDEMAADPRYAYRVAFVEVSTNSKGKADQAVTFVKGGSAEGGEISRILFKDREPPKYKPSHVVKLMQQEGFPRFRIHDHAQLWKSLKARKTGNGLGVHLEDGSWWWYQPWLEIVRKHCQDNATRYEHPTV